MALYQCLKLYPGIEICPHKTPLLTYCEDCDYRLLDRKLSELAEMKRMVGELCVKLKCD